MALTNDDENNRRLVEEYYRNIELGLPVTKRQAEVMEQAANSGQKRIDKEEVLIKTLGALGKGAKDYTKAMYDGQQGLGAMNSGVDSVVMALEVVLTLIPGFRILKFILMATVGAAAAYVKAANDQADALFKTYQDLSKTGMATAGGMTDIYNNMQKFNYGIKELGDMTALLKENSVALANFGGTAATGTKAFADAANAIQHSDIGKTFQMMGKTPDEINRGIAMFIKNQQAIGVKSADINKNLANESSRYVMQLDLLSKLTGQSAEQLQEKLDQAAAEEAFNQTQYELKKKADAGDATAARQYAENQKLAATLTGTTLKEFQQGVGGDISAMSKTMMTAQGAVALVQKGSYTAAEYLNALGKGAQESRDRYGNLMKMNATKDFLLPMSEIAASQSRYADQSAQNQEEMAKAEQELQKKGLDPTTKEMVKLRLEQQKTRDSMQNLVNKGVEPVTKAFGFLTDVINRIVGIVPGTESDVTKENKDNASNANVSADTKQIMAAIRTHESRGDYQAQSSNSNATGAYQFLDSSWQALTKKYGMGKEYASAKLAPKDVQDAIAAKFIDEILKANGNDPKAVFNTWYTGNAKGIISKEAMAKNNNLTAEQMTEQFMAILRKQQGQSNSGPETKKSENTKNETPPPTTITPSTAGNPPWLQQPEIKADSGWDGMLDGPASGYRPNLTMHGTEELKITPKSDVASTVSATGRKPKATEELKTSPKSESTSLFKDFQQIMGGDILAMNKSMTNAKDVLNSLSKGAQESRDLYGNLIKQNSTKDFVLPKSTVEYLNTLGKGAQESTDLYSNLMKQTANKDFLSPKSTEESKTIPKLDGMPTSPLSGYKPSATMPKTEDLQTSTKENTDNTNPTAGTDTNTLLQQQTSKLDELIRILGDQQQNDLVFQQLDRLEDLNRVMQNQVSVSTKILQASR